MLTISASGGVKITASPPRAEKGECHPGCSRTISAIATGATSDKPNPTLPALDCGWFSSGGTGLPAFMSKSFHICGVTSMAARLKAEC